MDEMDWVNILKGTSTSMYIYSTCRYMYMYLLDRVLTDRDGCLEEVSLTGGEEWVGEGGGEGEGEGEREALGLAPTGSVGGGWEERVCSRLCLAAILSLHACCWEWTIVISRCKPSPVEPGEREGHANVHPTYVHVYTLCTCAYIRVHVHVRITTQAIA